MSTRIPKPPSKRVTRKSIDGGFSRILAIGNKKNLKIKEWIKQCSSVSADGDKHVVVMETGDFIVICYSLGDLAQHLYDLKSSDEELVDLRGNKIKTSSYNQIIKNARKHLKGTFGEFYNHREITKVSNQIVQKKLLEHNATIHQAKREFRNEEINRKEYQKKVQASSNEFDIEYTNVKKRAREVMESLKETEVLTVAKVRKAMTDK